MKNKARFVAVLLSVMCICAFVFPMMAFAAGGTSLDDLSGQSTEPSSTQTGDQSSSTSQSDNGTAIEDYLRGYTPVTGENMEQASAIANPIVNIIGTVSGFIVMIASASIFLITAIDLLYIAAPPLRGILNPAYASASANPAGAMPMGVGGMGMGMGRMMGGVMGGFGAGVNCGEAGLRRRWVSDEADYCVTTFALKPQQQGAGAGSMPMMGGAGMMPGAGMPMPAMGGQPRMSSRSIIFEYLKKRSFFLIIFAVATVILMSSIFTDCGLNIATLLTKLINRGSAHIANVEV